MLINAIIFNPLVAEAAMLLEQDKRDRGSSRSRRSLECKYKDLGATF